MKANRMKTVEYFKEFVDTQHKVGALVDIYYIRHNSKVMVYTNLKFRIATTMSLADLEEFLKEYPRKKRSLETLVNFELREVAQ